MKSGAGESVPSSLLHKRIVRDFRNGGSISDAAAMHGVTPLEAENVIRAWVRTKR